MTTESKRCRVCGLLKTLNEFSPEQTASDKHRSDCKSCHAENRRVWRHDNREKLRARRRTRKYRDAENAYRRRLRLRKGSEVRAKARAYDATHRDRVNEIWRKQYWKNPEKRRANSSRHRRLKPEAVRAGKRRWYLANVEHVTEKTKAYRKRRPEIPALVDARRRALKAATAIEKVDYAAIKRRDRMICHICRLPVVEDELSFDHVIPLSKGGPHIERNARSGS